MAYNPRAQHGYADQMKFMEIPISEIPSLTGMEEPTQVAGVGENRRFAQLVYQVNSSPLEISGDIMVDNSVLEEINSDGFATLSAQLDAGIIDPALNMVVESDSLSTWVAEAMPGTGRGVASWRAKQIIEIAGAVTTTLITWADGNGDFDNLASAPLSGLTYS